MYKPDMPIKFSEASSRYEMMRSFASRNSDGTGSEFRPSFGPLGIFTDEIEKLPNNNGEESDSEKE